MTKPDSDNTPHFADKDHIDVLDGVRGVAALMVVVSHSANSGLLPGFLGNGLGQMGVGLFFGLSGFLMAHLYLWRPPEGAELRRYFVHRGARVLPLYFAVLAVALAINAAFNLELFRIQTATDVALNALLVRGTGVLWSVPTEIHFYLVFVVLWLAHARGRLGYAIAAVVLLQVVLFIATYRHVEHDTLIRWLQFFLFGMLLSKYLPTIRQFAEKPTRRRWLAVASWIVFIAALAAPPELRRQAGIPVLPNYLDPVTAGIPMLLLIFAVIGLPPFGVFRLPVLRWYGNISYALYLIHTPVLLLVIAQVAAGRVPMWAGFILVVSVSTLLAWASLHLYERPAQSAIRRGFRGPKSAPRGEETT